MHVPPCCGVPASTLTLQNCDGAEIQQTPKDVGSAEGLEAAGIIALCRSGEHRDLL
jgi:hypothetical protein